MTTERAQKRNHEIYKFVTTPEADRLGELYLLQADLKAAFDTLSLYFGDYAFTESLEPGSDALVSASLFRDGILLYCSCFSTKEPNKLEPEAVYGHLAGWKEYYQKILDLRDSFVAHNFGPARQHNVIAICLDIEGELLATGFTQHFMRFAGWLASEGEQFLSFIDVARDHLAKSIKEAEDAVRDTLAEFTGDELAALPDADLAIPEASDLRTSRSRFRKERRGERRPLPPRWLGRSVVQS